jgi:hypothetical protein
MDVGSHLRKPRNTGVIRNRRLGGSGLGSRVNGRRTSDDQPDTAIREPGQSPDLFITNGVVGVSRSTARRGAWHEPVTQFGIFQQYRYKEIRFRHRVTLPQIVRNWCGMEKRLYKMHEQAQDGTFGHTNTGLSSFFFSHDQEGRETRSDDSTPQYPEYSTLIT